jgi:hypothetical protein
MTTTATKIYQVTVIERALAFYEVEAEDARTAAENWQDGEFDGRDDEALDNEGPTSVREQRPDGTGRKVPKPEWQSTTEIIRFDDYEIHGVREYHGAPFGQGTYCEQVPDDEAQFWSLYGHIPGQGLECIGDFKTRVHAEEVYARITGRCHGRQS